MIARLAAFSLLTLASVGCVASHHPARLSPLGSPPSGPAFTQRLSEPGPLKVETVVAADWVVPRSGLVNLDHPTAKSAGLKDGDEPIQVYLHVIRHPTRGTFIIDTGIEQALRDAPEKAAIRGFVANFLNTEKMRVYTTTAEWLKKEPAPLSGVLLTHLHLDHVSGLPDVPKSTPVYVGPGENTHRKFLNMFVSGSLDRALEGFGPLNEWRFEADSTGLFEGIVDVLGDGSLWALWVPGHTPGSTAYLARTTEGPVLFVGDASHTAWGWDHAVEPGSFSSDKPRSAKSLARLQALVKAHPEISVRLGHQHRDAPGTSSAQR